MRSFRPADVYALPNLLFNGGLDYLEPQEHGVPLPHFWTFTGLSPRTLSKGSVSSYDVVEGETITKRGQLRDYLKLTLLNADQVRLTQSFLSDSVMDFPVPLAPRTTRREMAAGYRSRYERLLSRSRSYSFGVSVRVPRGACDVRIRFLDTQGRVLTEERIGTDIRSTNTSQQWRRYTGVLTPSACPAAAVFVIQRVAGSELTEVHLGFFQMVLGAYTQVPYTGDQSLGAIPSDSIVMVMGETCPPGFTALEEPEGVEVPESWVADDPEALVRRGNFPIGSDGDGDVDGDPRHNRTEGYDFEMTQNQVVAFESANSSFGSSTTGSPSHNPAVLSPADEPNEEGETDHQHTVRDAGSIPVNRQFQFCRRL